MSACPESKQLLQEINGEQKQKKGEVCSGKYTEQIQKIKKNIEHQVV